MTGFETILILMGAAVVLVGMAQKYHIPYPIALVLGGAFIGFIPGLQTPEFDPNLILVAVLPPILYYAAFSISFREFTENWREIFSLALGLVAVTTLVIGCIFKWMFPEFSWALCFAFGAIVSPPDAIAVTAILKRFNINSKLVTLLEGESLVNDASALVLYKLAVIALFTESFSLTTGSLDFLKVVIGGIAIGILFGLIFQLFSRKYLEATLGVVFSFTIPYITFIVASYLGFSGVLAVVVNGLIGARILHTHNSSLRRVLGYASWDIFTILLNCFVFILIGLQLRTILKELTVNQALLYSFYACIIALAMCVIRMIWVYAKSGFAYFKALNSKKASEICPQILKEAAITSWAGMRGIVSLSAAIALPFVLSDGAPLKGRDEVIFITFIVILLTLVIPGLTLPILIKWLKMPHHKEHEHVNQIREQLMHIAEMNLQKLFDENKITKKEVDFLKSYFMTQSAVQEMSHKDKEKTESVELARLTVIKEQRSHLLKMWKHEEIDDKLLSHLEDELDLVEVHIARAELK